MNVRALLVSFSLLAAATASAQSVTPTPVDPTAIEVLVFAPGVPTDGTPTRSLVTAISPAYPLGNQSAPTTPVTTSPTNPTFIYVDDPFHPGQVLFAPIPSGLPDGTGYRLATVFDAPSCNDATTGAIIAPCNSFRGVIALPFTVAPTLLPVRHAPPTGGAFKP